MSIRVDVRRPIVSPTRAVVGAPVAAPQQWSDVIAAAHWCKGKGAQLVPSVCPNTEIKSASEQIYRFRVKPRTSAVERIWRITVELTGTVAFATTEAEIRCPATTGVLLNATASTASGFRQITYVETLVARSSTEQEISIGITVPGATASGGCFVRMISCYEQDRPFLVADATDVPVSPETVRPGEPIGLGTYTSLGGVLSTIAGMDARRVGIFHWASPSAVSRLSASPTDFFDVKPYIQAPKLNVGATTGTVRWAVYAAMSSGGGTGNVTVSTTSGASDSIAVTSTTAAWIDGGTFDIYCDDFSAVDGQVDDVLSIQWNSDGTRSIQVYSISIWVESVA